MKKILIFLTACIISLLLAPPFVFAEVFQANIEVQCVDDFHTLQKRIFESKYKETTHWGGGSEDDRTIFILYTNEETKTWTLVQTDGKFACLLGNGVRSQDVKQIKNGAGYRVRTDLSSLEN